MPFMQQYCFSHRIVVSRARDYSQTWVEHNFRLFGAPLLEFTCLWAFTSLECNGGFLNFSSLIKERPALIVLLQRKNAVLVVKFCQFAFDSTGYSYGDMAVLKPRDGQNPKWVRCDLSEIFENESLQKHLDDLSSQQELEFVEDKSAPPPYDFPDIGANRLQPAALKHLCTELSGYMERAVAPVSDFPAYMILERREFVWARVIEACLHQFYSEGSLRRAIAALKKEKEEGEGKKSKEASKTRDSTEKLSGNDVLIEVGVRTGMSIVFSLLKQAWAQFTWQKQLEQQLQLSGATLPLPGGQLNLPNQVLRSVLDVLKGIPPLSLANVKALSKLSSSCLEQASEFLNWIVQSTSFVDAEGKRLASEILLSLALQHGNLNSLLEWLGNVLCCLTSYKAEAAESDGSSGDHTSYPHLSLEFCLGVLEEIRKRTVRKLGVQRPCFQTTLCAKELVPHRGVGASNSIRTPRRVELLTRSAKSRR